MDAMDIIKVIEGGVSLPILVFIWMTVRGNSKAIKELGTHNKTGHGILHRRIDRLPCEREVTSPGIPCPAKRKV